jgi:hypothetical protein
MTDSHITYEGKPLGHGVYEVRRTTTVGRTEPLDPRHDLAQYGSGHFAWGYGGYYARQTALALLADAIDDNERALRLAVAYTAAHFAGIDAQASWRLSRQELRDQANAIEAPYREKIRKALATPGGHLSIGPEGCTLHWTEPGCLPDSPGPTHCRLSGADPRLLKGLALDAGLPILDCSRSPTSTAIALLIDGPLVAVGRAPDPQPWHRLASAPLDHVAGLYRAAGAEVHNLPNLP